MVYICSVFFLPVLLEISEYLTKQTRNFSFRLRIGKSSLFSNINRETIWELFMIITRERGSLLLRRRNEKFYKLVS